MFSQQNWVMKFVSWWVYEKHKCLKQTKAWIFHTVEPSFWSGHLKSVAKAPWWLSGVCFLRDRVRLKWCGYFGHHCRHLPSFLWAGMWHSSRVQTFNGLTEKIKCSSKIETVLSNTLISNLIQMKEYFQLTSELTDDDLRTATRVWGH